MSEEDGFTYYTQAFAETPEQGDDTFNVAQAMYDNGLIWLANRALHPFGYALGVTVNAHGKVTHFNLHYSTDPQGVWFGEDLELRGRRKFYAALKGLAGHLGW